MITVHVFCSYKLSSSGFQYGTFVYNPGGHGECYYLSDKYKVTFMVMNMKKQEKMLL